MFLNYISTKKINFNKKNINSFTDNKKTEIRKYSFWKNFNISSLFEMVFPKKHIVQCVGSSSAAASSHQEWQQPREAAFPQADENTQRNEEKLLHFSLPIFAQNFPDATEKFIFDSSLDKILFFLEKTLLKIKTGTESTQTREEVRLVFSTFTKNVKKLSYYFDDSLTEEEKQELERTEQSFTEKEKELIDKGIQILYFTLYEPEKVSRYFQNAYDFDTNLDNVCRVVLKDLFDRLRGKQPIFQEEFLQEENIVKARLNTISIFEKLTLGQNIINFFTKNFVDICYLLDFQKDYKIREIVKTRIRNEILTNEVFYNKYHIEDMLNLLEETFSVCSSLAKTKVLSMPEKEQHAITIIGDFINRLWDSENKFFPKEFYLFLSVEKNYLFLRDLEETNVVDKQVTQFHYKSLIRSVIRQPLKTFLESDQREALEKATALRLHLSEYQFLENMNESFIYGFLSHLIRRHLFFDHGKTLFFPSSFYQLDNLSYFQNRMKREKAFFTALPTPFFLDKALHNFEKPDVFVTLPALVLASESIHQSSKIDPSNRDLEIMADYLIQHNEIYTLMKIVHTNSIQYKEERKKNEYITNKLFSLFSRKISQIGVLTPELKDVSTKILERNISLFRHVFHPDSPWRHYLSEIEIIDMVTCHFEREIKGIKEESPSSIFDRDFSLFFDSTKNPDEYYLLLNEFYADSAKQVVHRNVQQVIQGHKFLKEFEKIRIGLETRIEKIKTTKRTLRTFNYKHEELVAFSQKYFCSTPNRAIFPQGISFVSVRKMSQEFQKDLKIKRAALLRVQAELRETSEMAENFSSTTRLLASDKDLFQEDSE